MFQFLLIIVLFFLQIGAGAMSSDRHHGSREIDVEPGESDHLPDTFRTE